jgi:hypothetical protein
MYITEVLTKTKTGAIAHRCVLLRETYRENGKVKNRTLANLTHWPPQNVAALRLALQHKGKLTDLTSLPDSLELRQGPSIGAAWLVYAVAQRLGIEKALGPSRAGKVALWQVMARVIAQGSRLSAVRLAQVHAACDLLGLPKGFHEEHLYKNLAWLSSRQKSIEQQLLHARRKGSKPALFLYDVTSSYVEGIHHALADWGYNRDKKSGKKQGVVGLLCDEEGDPVSIDVFVGNTRDFDTLKSQVDKAATDFGCKRILFVGDRGMIKSKQMAQLNDAEFYYLTAITKPQIEKLLKTGVFQIDWFDRALYEVEPDSVRYILRRNPQRVADIRRTRQEKQAAITQLCHQKNGYLADHPRAQVQTAIKEIEGRMARLKVAGWLRLEAHGRQLHLQEDTEALAKEAKLDGCYVLKSDAPKDLATHLLHARYKDLADVEHAFRTCKTALLEMRPWYVWSEKSTRGHALVVMLAYLVTRYLQHVWAEVDLTVEEGLHQLSQLCSIEIVINHQSSSHTIPTPDPTMATLLEAAQVRLPKTLPHLGAHVVSRKKLPSRRKPIELTSVPSC